MRVEETKDAYLYFSVPESLVLPAPRRVAPYDGHDTTQSLRVMHSQALVTFMSLFPDIEGPGSRAKVKASLVF